MNFYKPDTLTETLKLLSELPDKKLLLAGGSDINILLRQKKNTTETVIFINHISELHGIDILNDKLIIGATTTISEISHSLLIRKHCPFLAASLADFASPPIANVATLAGNIANSSPTADTVPLLLVLDAEVVLKSLNSTRNIPLTEYYTGYKKTVLCDDEMIVVLEIPLLPISDYQSHYIKIGSRTALTIAKLSLAYIKYLDVYKIAAGSLSEYPRRLRHVEKYLSDNPLTQNDEALLKALQIDVTPITDFRSDKEYRLQVCFNYLRKFINDTQTL